MKYISAFIIFSILSCSTSNDKSKETLEKENELLKRELAIKTQEDSLEKEMKLQVKESKKEQSRPETVIPPRAAASIVSDILEIMNTDEFTSCNIDQRGNFEIDMGSFSAGRVGGKLGDIDIRREHREEEPGCADICPERILIHFTCKSNKCLYDPASKNDKNLLFDSSVIQFFDIQNGNNMFDLLVELKNTL